MNAHLECPRCHGPTRSAKMDGEPLALDVCLHCHVIVGTRDIPQPPVVDAENEEAFVTGKAWKPCPDCSD